MLTTLPGRFYRAVAKPERADVGIGLLRQSAKEAFGRRRYRVSGLLALALIVVLTLAVRSDDTAGIDRSVLAWITGQRWSFVESLFHGVSPVTRWTFHGATCLLGLVLFWVLGYRDRSVAILGAALVSGLVLYTMQLMMSQTAGQVRPVNYSGTLSFPSGHALSGFVVFGFAIFLMTHHSLNLKLRVPLIALAVVLTFASGLSRLYFVRHWPSDVAGAWLLGVLGLAVAIPVYLTLEKTLGPVMAKRESADSR